MSTTHAHATPAPASPGKMTLAMRAARWPPPDAPKALRVGLLEGGRVHGERLLRRRETVTIGSREKNHLVLAAADAPARHELFALRGDRWFLELGSGMQARVTDGQGAVDVAPGGAVPLVDASRGRVRIGDATVLFQFVVPPPLPPRPQLPAAARGNLVRSMDWLFTALVALSLVAHGGFVAYLNNADWPAQQGWEYVPRDVIDFVVTPLPAAAAIAPAPRPTDTQTNATDPIPADDGAAVPAPHRPNRPTRPAPSGDPRPDVRLAPDLSRVGINAVLASLGDGPGSVAADMLRGGHVDADQDDALAQVRGVQAPVGGRPTQLRPRDGGVAGPVRPVGQIDQQIVADQVIQTGDRDEQPVHGIARPGAPPDPIGGTGTLRVLDVRRVVNQALGGIQRCYERQLRNNPTLRGRVSVTFTVTGSGRVSGARAASSFDPTVGTCVASVVSRLRFPEPEGGAVAFAFPFVFEPGQR